MILMTHNPTSVTHANSGDRQGRRLTKRLVVWFPGSSIPCSAVSLSKALNPKLPPNDYYVWVMCGKEMIDHCVCDRVNDGTEV